MAKRSTLDGDLSARFLAMSRRIRRELPGPSDRNLAIVLVSLIETQVAAIVRKSFCGRSDKRHGFVDGPMAPLGTFYAQLLYLIMVIEKDVLLSVRVTSKLKDMVDTAAEKSGLTSSDWVRAVLARAANEGAFAPRKGDRHGSKSKRKPA